MRQIKLLALFSFFFTSTLFSQIKLIGDKPYMIGEEVTIYSTILEEERILNISFPVGYHRDSLETYQIIYLLDGSYDEDFVHITGLVQFGNFSWIDLLPRSIVVGISNIDRKKDFTFPTPIAEDKKDFSTTGGSANFIQFIKTELQPFIENRYPTNGDKMIIGQSLGGLLATEILLNEPQLFTHYMIVSPSLWWGEESLLALAKTLPKTHFRGIKRISVSVGKEGRVMQRDAKALYKILKQEYSTEQLSYAYYKEQNHGDVLHLAAYHAFEVMFKK